MLSISPRSSSGADDHHLQATRSARLLVDLMADRLQVLLHEVLDVPLVARLRPATLAVLPRRLLALVDDLDEPAAGGAVDAASLPREDGDEAPVVPELPRERRDREFAPDPHEIAHGLGQRQRPELPVGGRREHRHALRAVALELVVPPGPDARQVVAQSQPAVPRRAVGIRRLLELGEEGVELRLGRAGVVGLDDGSRSR